MRKSFAIFFLPFLPLMLACFSACHSLKEPMYKGVSDFRVSKFTAGVSTLSLAINYYNPNKSKLVLKEVKGEAWMNNNYLGHFYSDTVIHIGANSDFSIPVFLEADMKNMAINMATAMLNENVSIKIDGKARIGKVGVFIRCPIHYEGTENLGQLIH